MYFFSIKVVNIRIELKRFFYLLFTSLILNLQFADIILAQQIGSCGPVDYYHTKVLDKDNHLDSWHKDNNGSFEYALNLCADWWKGAPESKGWPRWCTAAVLDKQYNQYNGAIPGTACAFGIIACLKYYAYSGDTAFRNMAIRTGNYIIQQDLTPSFYKKYSHFPYAVGTLGDINPDGSGHPEFNPAMNLPGNIQPDKGAMLGVALLELYKATGSETFLKIAINIANCLSENAVIGTEANSPWPMRVMADNDSIIDGKFSANVSYACRLFDELLRLGHKGNGKYSSTRNSVWNWLKTCVISYDDASRWMCFFEDHSGNEINPTQTNALETARYLLEKKEDADPDWFNISGKILIQVQNRWALTTLKDDGFVCIAEQELDRSPYNSHTARFASILSMYYEAGADLSFKEIAYHSLCYGIYSIENDGFTNTYYRNISNGKSWTSDSFGDFIGHYIDAFAAIPEWAGSGNHLLRSSSTIKNIEYKGTNLVSYKTFDDKGIDKLKLINEPIFVRVDGKPVSSYIWDNKTKVLLIKRSGGTNVTLTIASQ